MTKPYHKTTTSIDQAKITGQMTKKERELAKWFLDKNWTDAKKNDLWTYYHSSMGWIFCNSFILSNQSPLGQAFTALDIIKEKCPDAYKNFMESCKADLKELEPESASDNIVSFPKGERDVNT